MAPHEDAEYILYEFMSAMKSPPPTAPVMPGFLTQLRRRLRRAAGGFDPVAGKGRIWLHATTQNQRESLSSVAAALGKDAFDAGLFSPFTDWGAALDSACAGIDRKMTQASLRAVYRLAVGEAVLIEKALRTHPPAAVLTTNDHSPRHRGLILAARRAGVQVAYLQHAAVGGVEPPLNQFGLALLHGPHAADHYRRRGPLAPRTYFVGAPKLDESTADHCEQGAAQAIGVCPALNTDAKAIRKIVDVVRSVAKDRPVIVRLHPRANHLPAPPDGVQMSDAKHESTPAFLRRLKALVVDDSNIAIEALALGVQSVRVSFDGRLRDQYGISGDPAFASWETDIRGLPAGIEKALDADCATVRAAAARYFQDPGAETAGERVAAILRWAYLGGSKPKKLADWQVDPVRSDVNNREAL